LLENGRRVECEAGLDQQVSPSHWAGGQIQTATWRRDCCGRGVLYRAGAANSLIQCGFWIRMSRSTVSRHESNRKFAGLAAGWPVPGDLAGQPGVDVVKTIEMDGYCGSIRYAGGLSLWDPGVTDENEGSFP
jgi:hypothetical protein